MVLPFAPCINLYFWVSESQIFVYFAIQVILVIIIFVFPFQINLALPLPLHCHTVSWKFLQCFWSCQSYSSQVYACPKVPNAQKALLQKQASCLFSISVPSPTGADLTFKRKSFLWAASGTQKGRWKGHSHPFLLSAVILTQIFLPWNFPLISALSQKNFTKGKGVYVFNQYS